MIKLNALFYNSEFKVLAVRLAVVQLLLIAVFSGMIYLQLGEIREAVLQQNAAAAGKLLSESVSGSGSLEGRAVQEAAVAEAFTQPVEAEDVRRGMALLQQYGYAPGVSLDVHPVLKGVWQKAAVGTVIFWCVAMLVMSFLIYRGFSAVYQKVRRISTAAEAVMDGKFETLLPSGQEGDFEILGHRFNQMASRLQQSMEKLSSEKQFLKNIISDISHQLKTPLSTLMIYNELQTSEWQKAVAQDGSGKMPEVPDAATHLNFLTMSRQQLDRLEWLIQSLLKMTRLEAGSIEFRQEAVSLQHVAMTAMESLRPMAEGAGVQLKLLSDVHTPEDNGATFSGDSVWTSEALVNIIKNSIEHSAAGTQVSIKVWYTPLSCGITVADQGSGIDESDLPHVFKRFFRGSHSVKPNSIGIGLALSRAIVEGQGGSVSARSEKGNGSEFTLTFLKTLGK